MTKPPLFDPEEVIRLAKFAIGREVFAIDIMRIQEIVRPLPVTPVPKAPFGMVGVFNLRGRVLPLYDLRTFFGLKREKQDPRARFVIVRLDGRKIALVVDNVLEVFSVERKELKLGGRVFSGEAELFFVGVVPHRGRMVLLLNLHRILEGGEVLDLSEFELLPAPGLHGEDA